jgi:hypothetical protein
MRRADRCPHCGAPVRASRVSLRDIALITVCVVVLFSVGVPAILITAQWAEDETYRIMDRMVWHEPLDSWNL